MYTSAFYEYVYSSLCTHKYFQTEEFYTLKFLNLSYLQVYAF